MDIAVAEEKLSQAIGRGGQNIRLASQLTGWELNVMTESDAEAKSESEASRLVQMFMKSLDVGEDVATILAQEGFSTIEELAYVPVSELASIAEFDEEMVKELRNRARDVLLTQAIGQRGKHGKHHAADDLLALTGMNPDLALNWRVAACVPANSWPNRQLTIWRILMGLDEQGAGALIMKAREHWFQG